MFSHVLFPEHLEWKAGTVGNLLQLRFAPYFFVHYFYFQVELIISIPFLFFLNNLGGH